MAMNKERPYSPADTLVDLMKGAGHDVDGGGFSNTSANDGFITSDVPASAKGKDESMGYDCKVSAGTPDRGGVPTPGKASSGGSGKAS